MQLPKELTTVTPLSKTIALIMFTLLPILAFLIGVEYEKKQSEQPVYSNPQQKACTEDARICPDGSTVGRTGPNCEFAKCPTPTVKEDFYLPTPFRCPKSKWLNCMPGPNKNLKFCKEEFLIWAKANCPGFEGGAY